MKKELKHIIVFDIIIFILTFLCSLYLILLIFGLNPFSKGLTVKYGPDFIYAFLPITIVLFLACAISFVMLIYLIKKSKYEKGE